MTPEAFAAGKTTSALSGYTNELAVALRRCGGGRASLGDEIVAAPKEALELVDAHDVGSRFRERLGRMSRGRSGAALRAAYGISDGSRRPATRLLICATADAWFDQYARGFWQATMTARTDPRIVLGIVFWDAFLRGHRTRRALSLATSALSSFSLAAQCRPCVAMVGDGFAIPGAGAVALARHIDRRRFRRRRVRWARSGASARSATATRTAGAARSMSPPRPRMACDVDDPNRMRVPPRRCIRRRCRGRRCAVSDNADAIRWLVRAPEREHRLHVGVRRARAVAGRVRRHLQAASLEPAPRVRDLRRPPSAGLDVYVDDNHMNATFSATLGPFLLRTLR